jgi:hypothetical protein
MENNEHITLTIHSEFHGNEVRKEIKFETLEEAECFLKWIYEPFSSLPQQNGAYGLEILNPITQPQKEMKDYYKWKFIILDIWIPNNPQRDTKRYRLDESGKIVEVPMLTPSPEIPATATVD